MSAEQYQQLVRRLEKLAVKYEILSTRLHVDDPDGTEDAENDGLSQAYGDASGDLRALIAHARLEETGIEQLWEPVRATDDNNATLLLTPGEEFGTTTVPDDQWGMVLGDPDRVALVLLGTREEILHQLDDAAREIEHSYRAEHENAFHTEYEPQCPECNDPNQGPTQTCDAQGNYPAAALTRDAIAAVAAAQALDKQRG